jgi:hypothetical protein
MTKPTNKRVVYIPTPDETIEEVAVSMCQNLSETDSGFNTAEVRNGLANYLKVIMSIYSGPTEQAEVIG